MRYTSAEANKLLKKLNENKALLLSREVRGSVFRAASTEDPEAVRPDYSYAETRDQLDVIEAQIRTVKHAVNCFNAQTEVPGFGMTIDQMLIYIPQLTERKNKLSEMAARLPRERVHEFRSTIIDYELTNYDLETVAADLEAVTDELSRAQNALDRVNNSETMEIDLT